MLNGMKEYWEKKSCVASIIVLHSDGKAYGAGKLEPVPILRISSFNEWVSQGILYVKMIYKPSSYNSYLVLDSKR